MLIETVIFYIFAIFFVGTAVMVVTRQNTVHSALFLVLTFFSAAALWIMLEAEFLALILVLVYVGAVMTLFLFVIMMLHLEKLPTKQQIMRYLPFGILIIALMLVGLITAIGPHHFAGNTLSMPVGQGANYSNVKELGMVLYTQYAYAFEIAAVLLLVAIVAAISLSLRHPRRKSQDIAQQIKVKRNDRVSLVKMPAEKRQ